MYYNKSEQDLKIEEVPIKKLPDNQLLAVIKHKHLLVLDRTINLSPHQFKNLYQINNLLDCLVL